MARKRVIDPEFWSDEEIGNWSRSARLFYIGLWNFADDCGRFKAHSGLLKSQIFPYDDPKSLKIENLKKEVSAKIVWYEVNNSKYGYLLNFNKHQRIDKPQPSKLPPPPKDKFVDNSKIIRRTVPPNIKEENIREEKGGPQEVYEYYSKTIKAGAKEDAIRNITKLLKAYTKKDLLGWIDAYKQSILNSKKQDPDYYIQANNFFGQAARYKDFEPIKEIKYKKADPNCKKCKGQGKSLIEATNEVKICECRIIKE